MESGQARVYFLLSRHWWWWCCSALSDVLSVLYAPNNSYWSLEHGRSVTGTMEYHDGRVYRGEWKGGECHGVGTMSYPDGGYYKGQWTMGKRVGKGVMKWGGDDNGRKVLTTS